MRVIQLGDGTVEAQCEAPAPPQYPKFEDITIPAGQYPKGVRVAYVRLKTGATHTFGGELLDQALKNGAKIIRVLQDDKPNQ